MLWDTLSQSLSQHQMAYKPLATFLGCSVVSVIALRWMKKRHIVSRMEKERRRRESNLQMMEAAVKNFKKQNPHINSKSILKMPLVELAEKLKNGSLSPECVLYSYIEKALELTKELNCVTIFLPDLEMQLQELKKKKEKGPLYGIPVSIKEHIGYKGESSTCGLVQYLDELEKEDSVIVKVLKIQGAIVFAKTNIPQSLICYETSNPIYGHTLNPHNRAKGASGSSGGEGALIGAGGSILGMGTDIGGSIRLPSSFCGIAGFKPTPKRTSIHGIRPAIDGMLAVPLCVGPMARDVDSLVFCTRALYCEEMSQLDVTVPPIPFNEKLYTTERSLRIGYYETDGYVLPNPSMKRVLLETKNLLEQAGHKLIPFTPPKISYMINDLSMKSFFGDSETVQNKFKSNIVDPNLKDQVFMYNIPRAVKKILSIILRPLYPRIADIYVSACGASSVKEHWQDNIAVEEYQTEFVNEWKRLDLDVMLCPMLGPAFNIGYPGKLLVNISYTLLYNILQFPAGVVPVGSVTIDDEKDLKHYKGHFNDPLDNLFRKAVEDGIGLPLSVHCAALPYQDELCLRFMKEIENLTIQHQGNK